MEKYKDNYGLIDKIPPQATEIEQVVIGSMLLESAKIEEIIHILQPESFYFDKHKMIYQAIRDIYHRNDPVDILTVTQQLTKSGNLEIVGGPVYITDLMLRIGSTANVEYHARIILHKFLQREVIRICQEMTNEAYADNTDPLELVEKFGKQYDIISSLSQSGAEMVHISHIVNEVCAELVSREKFAKEGKVAGIPTPLREINRILGGWMNSDLVIIAARPSMGKTAFMLQAAKTAAEKGYNVCIFSMEMSRVSLTNRLVLAESGIDDDRFRSGYVDQYDWQKFRACKLSLKRLPIYIDDRPALSIHQIKAKASQMKRMGKCDLVMIDYLQLSTMKSENRNYNREQEVSESSRTSKAMAKTLNIPVLLLSQLSRESEKRGDKIPVLSDLRESGSIEQDADIVIFPHRPAYYDRESDQQGVINFIIAKHRNGATGIVSGQHNENMTRIFDRNYDETPEAF